MHGEPFLPINLVTIIKKVKQENVRYDIDCTELETLQYNIREKICIMS